MYTFEGPKSLPPTTNATIICYHHSPEPCSKVEWKGRQAARVYSYAFAQILQGFAEVLPSKLYPVLCEWKSLQMLSCSQQQNVQGC